MCFSTSNLTWLWIHYTHTNTLNTHTHTHTHLRGLWLSACRELPNKSLKAQHTEAANRPNNYRNAEWTCVYLLVSVKNTEMKQTLVLSPMSQWPPQYHSCCGVDSRRPLEWAASHFTFHFKLWRRQTTKLNEDCSEHVRQTRGGGGLQSWWLHVTQQPARSLSADSRAGSSLYHRLWAFCHFAECLHSRKTFITPLTSSRLTKLPKALSYSRFITSLGPRETFVLLFFAICSKLMKLFS